MEGYFNGNISYSQNKMSKRPNLKIDTTLPVIDNPSFNYTYLPKVPLTIDWKGVRNRDGANHSTRYFKELEENAKKKKNNE